MFLYIFQRTWFACWWLVVARQQIHHDYVENVEKCKCTSMQAIHSFSKQHSSNSFQESHMDIMPHVHHHTIAYYSSLTRAKCSARMYTVCVCAILHRNTLVTLNQFHGAVTVLCVHCRRYSTHTHHRRHFWFVHFWFRFRKIFVQKQPKPHWNSFLNILV